MTHTGVFLAVAIPYGSLVLAGIVYKPVRLQLKLTTRTTAEAYERVVADSGGPTAVRIGFAIDGLFIIGFGTAGTVALAMIGGPWPLPLAAAIVDAGEDVTALRLMNKTPSTRALRILKGIAVTKYAAYATAFAAMTYEAFA